MPVSLRRSVGYLSSSADLFESVLDMNARIGLYSLKGTFGGEWLAAADLLSTANMIHPRVLYLIREKYKPIIWQNVSDYSRILQKLGLSEEQVELCVSEHLLLILDPPSLHASWVQPLQQCTYEWR